MEILFMVFMVFVSITTLFAVLVVLRDIVKEIANSKRKSASDKVEPVKEQVAKISEPIIVETPAPACEPTEEPKVEDTAVLEEIATSVDTKISFSAGEVKTLVEKYNALSKKDKKRYDEIVNYAKSVEGNRCFKNDRYEEYKVGTNRLVRMLIKRGVIVCEFILHNSDFKNYVNQNKISVKQSATTIKVLDDSSVAVAKSSIDIAVAEIKKEKEFKKQLAREKRRAKNQNKA